MSDQEAAKAPDETETIEDAVIMYAGIIGGDDWAENGELLGLTSSQQQALESVASYGGGKVLVFLMTAGLDVEPVYEDTDG